jgi:hypothetical protein
MASITYTVDYDEDYEEEVPPITSLETVLEEAEIEQPDKNEEELKEDVDDIDSIERYVPRTGLIDLNVTQTQRDLSRQASARLTRS